MDLQQYLLDWAAGQHVLTGVAILGVGIVCAFFGFRMFAFVLLSTCAAIGFAAGYAYGVFGGYDPVLVGAVASAGLALIALKFERIAMPIASAGIYGTLAYYVMHQLGFILEIHLVLTALAAAVGFVFGIITVRGTQVFVAATLGIILIVTGFVTVSTGVIPTIGTTFRDWAHKQALVIPIFLGMLFTAGYSFQRMHQQGDIKTGN